MLEHYMQQRWVDATEVTIIMTNQLIDRFKDRIDRQWLTWDKLINRLCARNKTYQKVIIEYLQLT